MRLGVVSKPFIKLISPFLSACPEMPSRKSILALNACELAAYKRVATVLLKYLPSSKEIN